MIASMDSRRPYNKEQSPFKEWFSNLNFFQRRLVRFGVSMIVFALCLPLYYLGFFGSVEGPLNPSNIGRTLAGFGVTKTHSFIFFLSFLAIALSWNLIFNYVSLIIGSRLTCKKTDDEGHLCGARAERKKVLHKRTGKMVSQYICAQGHKLPEAHFHPVQKGVVSHTIWVIALMFCLIVFFLS